MRAAASQAPFTFTPERGQPIWSCGYPWQGDAWVGGAGRGVEGMSPSWLVKIRSAGGVCLGADDDSVCMVRQLGKVDVIKPRGFRDDQHGIGEKIGGNYNPLVGRRSQITAPTCTASELGRIIHRGAELLAAADSAAAKKSDVGCGCPG
ncbi:hypothetical protein GGTG_00415 [Gaeumannomyces tritici R3-111a-1]|uniref:Uncharacterized protein n=1 Tax=Gaeumannomyces tritici (strain R3-111a-1) TaxID=644352 RepID=J3NGM6_GAET3|nr:hypothetical protein GGTG_00415 [Gaeumannomyces tritici R3-111a-1]EJT80416.1 hypothetical protein GGTG_00415 [Gaeumannomyces tritici R3-111a-1]